MTAILVAVIPDSKELIANSKRSRHGRCFKRLKLERSLTVVDEAESPAASSTVYTQGIHFSMTIAVSL
jgi:hypothetical protein